jgi:hypothetical protein
MAQSFSGAWVVGGCRLVLRRRNTSVIFIGVIPIFGRLLAEGG